MLVRSYRETFGLDVAVARCANIYGGGDLNFSRLIPGAIRSVLMGERPILRSDGSPVRDYLHVDDAVAAYLTLGERFEQVRHGRLRVQLRRRATDLGPRDAPAGPRDLRLRGPRP